MTRVKIRRGEIYFPHINYTVNVKTFTGNPPDPIANADAYVDPTHVGMCSVYFRPITSPHLITHEITHILRLMCMDRHMNFNNESEHMAYIAQYLMLRITGGSYRPR